MFWSWKVTRVMTESLLLWLAALLAVFMILDTFAVVRQLIAECDVSRHGHNLTHRQRCRGEEKYERRERVATQKRRRFEQPTGVGLPVFFEGDVMLRDDGSNPMKVWLGRV
jgi:hypothetical protein